ncbi:LytTR family DNA-binding domain-containing protein [Aquicoccus sp. G2-2]|uniref:LytTR family DNA-binding domain-containing protein n=1 Tax=Aquicoccus sp. G2-2 TaxID=3092120 RepID=UPI002AE072FA|nr:LytTR family DNA-binding domain-containing protein [Aquicoccus sp. G2-2]MEA1113677.1 LytTR family DNA-binding domain-containing protein [Aquicoccus sp. G2-2]
MARRPEWQIEIASIVVLVTVLTFVIRIGSPVIVGEQASQDMPDTSVLALYVISIAVPVAVLRQIWTSISTATAQSLESAPRLLLRLPEDARAPVLRLSSRDHQVEVVTRLGAVLIRMRLADAIAEMEPVPGYGTHRSHWVAAAAIEGVEQDGNRTFLLLVNGDRVPVGKKYRPGLESMGVL